MSWQERIATPAWKTAEDLVRLVNPLARGLLVDDLLKGAEIEWHRLPLDSADSEIARMLWTVCRPPAGGLVVVVSDASWMTAGPIVVGADRLNDLFAMHSELYGEPCFGGDVIIIGVSPPRVVVVHHNGLAGEVLAPNNHR